MHSLEYYSMKYSGIQICLYRYIIVITTVLKALTSLEVKTSVWPSFFQVYLAQELLIAFHLLTTLLESLNAFSGFESPSPPSICVSALTFLRGPVLVSSLREASSPNLPVRLPSLTPDAPATYLPP